MLRTQAKKFAWVFVVFVWEGSYGIDGNGRPTSGVPDSTFGVKHSIYRAGDSTLSVELSTLI